MLEHLPEDVLFKVFELLSTKEIARQACICRSWRDTVMNNMVSITLYPDLDELERQCAWLAKVADIRPQMLQTLQLHRMRTGPQFHLGVLPGLTRLQNFTNLRRLILAGSERQDHKFTQSRVTLTASTVQNLSSLIYLEELVIKYKPIDSHTTWQAHKNVISFSEFSAFPRMQHLEVDLVGLFGCNFHLDMSPQMEGLKNLKHLGVGVLKSLEINPTMAAIANRLQVFKLDIENPPDQVLIMPQLTGLVLMLSPPSERGTHRLPCNLPKLRELSFKAPGALVELTQQLSTLSDFTKLVLEQNCLNPSAVRHFSCLENLKQLHFGSYIMDTTEPSMLAPFTCLRSLEALTIMDCFSSGHDRHYRGKYIEVLLGENEALQKLRSLHIKSSKLHTSTNLDVDMHCLPVLTHLEAHVRGFAHAFHSSTLEVLRLDLSIVKPLTEATATPLGDLQRLHTLHAHLSLSNQEVWALAKEITALDNLKHIILRRKQSSAELINPMLAALSHVQHIKSLELHDQYKCVILDNEDPPLVEHLRIHCYKLRLTPAFASRLERSFQYQLLSMHETPIKVQERGFLELLSDDGDDENQLPVHLPACTGVTCYRK